MKNIEKDEIYDWHPCQHPDNVEARIPDHLHKCLVDAISVYRGVCKMIYEYLETHPDDEFKI